MGGVGVWRAGGSLSTQTPREGKKDAVDLIKSKDAVEFTGTRAQLESPNRIKYDLLPLKIVSSLNPQ